ARIRTSNRGQGGRWDPKTGPGPAARRAGGGTGRRGERRSRRPASRAGGTRRGGGRPPAPATAPRRACTRAAERRTAGSQRLQQGCLEHLIPGRDEGPGHAAREMRDRAAIDLEVRSREGGGSEPQQGGGAALPRRPAPVQRGVVAGEGLEAGRKSAERHQLTAALGVLQRRTRGVEAGSVDLGGGDARLE